MAIKYTNVINSIVSTEGSNGIMTNYVYYTILVVNTDGSSDIVEGKLNQVSHLLRYVRTPVDELMELKETVKGLRQDINDMVDQKMKYVIDSLYPIPDIREKNEVEALTLLKDAGLTPLLENQYPNDTPPNGIVRAYSRNANNFKKVNVKIIHDVPKVDGMKIEEALANLHAAGFTADVTHKVVSGKENGIVLRCSRANENKLLVDVEVSSSIPETKGMNSEEAIKTLKDAGYDVVTEMQISTSAPGTVTSWSSLNEKKIKLYISIPEKYEAKYVDVKWSDMQDSTGDTYGAIAEYHNRTQTLEIQLSYTLGAKSKHIINGIDYKPVGQEKPQLSLLRTMEPNTKGSLRISIPFGKPFEEIPCNISLSLDTQFGLMKKKDTIPLQFAIDW